MLRKMSAAALAVGTIGAALAAGSGNAEAHRRHHHHHRGYVAAGVVGGLAVGAAIAGSRYYGGGPYYYGYSRRPSVVYAPVYRTRTLPTYWSTGGCRTTYYAVPATYGSYGCCNYRRSCGGW